MIRIESIKIELDEIGETFKDSLEKAKQEFLEYLALNLNLLKKKNFYFKLFKVLSMEVLIIKI